MDHCRLVETLAIFTGLNGEDVTGNCMSGGEGGGRGS